MLDLDLVHVFEFKIGIRGILSELWGLIEKSIMLCAK